MNRHPHGEAEDEIVAMTLRTRLIVLLLFPLAFCTLWEEIAVAQVVSLSATSIPFGNVAVGATFTRSLKITNTGTSSLIITGITATSNFQSSGCGSANLAPNGNCTVSVSFTPPTTGSFTGTLTITDNASNSPQTASLTGSGVQPVTLSPSGTINFVSQVVNTTSGVKTATLTNNQSVPLNITSVTTTGDYAASSCATPLAAYGSCVISITFTPHAVGMRTGTLTVADNASTNPQTVSLSGTGVLSSVSLSLTLLQFSSQVVGTTSTAKTVTLTNNQTTTLSLTSVATTGPFATTTCPASLPASGTCAISVTFTPSAAGNSSGTLSVVDNASGSPQTATLQGIGAAVQLTSITVAPANPSIASGTTQPFTATGNYNNGTTANLTNSVIWTSSVMSLATINSAGLATAVAAGTSSVTATSGTISGSTLLTVTAPTLVSIAVTPANPSIAAGTTQQFTATGAYTDGSTKNLASSVTWGSSNTATASVTSTGLATGAGVAAATITATSGSISGSTTLTVTPAVLMSITLTPLNPSVALGATQQVTATGTFTDGTAQDLTNSATWSSSNIATATVSSTGLAKGVVQGIATISATSGSVTGTDNLTVTAATLSSITVTPTNPSIALGTTQQFTATGTFTNGTTQDLTITATWASTTTSVATVNSTGLCSSATTGTTTISATSGSIVGSTSLTVTPAALASIAVSPNSPSIPLGTNQQFVATGTYTDGTTQDLTTTAYWTSSVAGVATISDAAGSQGLVTSVGAGAATITATMGTISGTANLTVTAYVALVSITVAPANPSIPLGTTQQFTATGNYSDGTTLNLTSSAAWTSTTATVAAINGTGLASSAAIGTTTIAATSGSISGSTVLTVTAAVLNTIAVTPANSSIPLGVAVQFAAIGTFSDGTQQSLTNTAVWTSSTFASSISSSGLASTSALGTTTITAASGSVIGSTTLTVTAPALISIIVTPASVSMPLGTTQQLAATGTYTDGSQQNLTGLVAWSSANNAVASVNAAGLATSAAMGSTNIFAGLGSVAGATSLAVSTPALVSISITPSSSTVSLYLPQQFTATGTFTDGSTQNLTSTGVTWSAGGVVGGNATVGTISSAGVYTPPVMLPNPAQVTITATSTADPTKSGSATLTLVQIILTLSPTTAQVRVGATQQFTANVMGGTNSNVSWSVGGVLGGNSTLGTISTSGLYTAPAMLPNPAQVTITAISAVDGVTSANATVTVAPIITVAVSPSTLQFVSSLASRQFTATVTGTSNTAVTWSAGGMPGGNIFVGTISSSGLYSGPSVIPNPAKLYVTATSVADPTKSASTIVSVGPPAGVSVMISPVSSWMITGQASQFSDGVFGTSNAAVTWSVNGVVGGNATAGTISTGGLYTAPSVVPVPAQVSFTATSVANPAKSATGIVTIASTPFSATPLIDFAPGQLYLGQFSGMLYNGNNSPPADHFAAGQAAGGAVQPLDTNGNPSPNGKIVLISVGMSEAFDDWCDGTTCTSYSFMGQAATNSNVNHTTLTIMDGAHSGTTAPSWACPYGDCPLNVSLTNEYDRVRDTLLSPAGLTEAQVQTVWIQNADPSPTWGSSLPSSLADAYDYVYETGQVISAIKIRWPNVKQVFFSSRIYAGYATTNQSPEPYAYEYGFGVKFFINAQIQQRETGVIDPLAGDLLTSAPWVDWGPYLWGNGTNNPPGSLALTWVPNDFTPDGIHPSTPGVTKVGGALLNFFLNSPVTPWFRQ